MNRSTDKASAGNGFSIPLLVFLLAAGLTALVWILTTVRSGLENGASNDRAEAVAPASGSSAGSQADAGRRGDPAANSEDLPEEGEQNGMEESAELVTYEQEFSAEALIARLKGKNELIEKTDTYAVFAVQESGAGTSGQIHELVSEILSNAPERTEEIGLQLMTSEHPALRAAGAVLLITGNGLTEKQVDALAGDPDIRVPLLLMSALESRGYWEVIRDFSSRVAPLYAEESLWAVVNHKESDPEIRRRALSLLTEKSAEKPSERIANVILDSSGAIEVRLAALSGLSRTRPEEFLRLAERSFKDGDVRWKSAVEDLMIWRDLTDDSSPEEIHTEEINAILDGEHRDALFILATLMRSAVGDRPDSMDTDTRNYLYRTLDGFRNRPLSGEQRYWLQVLEGLCKNNGVVSEPARTENDFF